MPETPRTPRHSVRPTLDGTPASTPTSRPRSRCDSATVQDRIRQWQAQGAANALAPDAVSVRSIPTSVASTDVSRPSSPIDNAPKSANARRNRWTTQMLESPTKQRDSQNSSAPRKRLVSDEHWKSSRRDTAKKSPSSARRRDVVTPHHDLTYTSTARKEEREARRERRRQGRSSREGVSEPVLAEPKDLNAYIEEQLAQQLAPSANRRDRSRERSVSDHDDVHSVRSYSLYDDMAHTATPSRYADTLGQPEPLSLGSKRTTGGRILSKTREIFNKADSAPVSNRVPSIQAWLEEQPDPFVDASPDMDIDLPKVEVPEPLKKRSRRTKTRAEDPVPADPNKIWESVTTYRVRDGTVDQLPKPVSPHVEPSPAPPVRATSGPPPEEEIEGGSPRSIRRRGAARTRRSRRSDNDTPPETPPKRDGALQSSSPRTERGSRDRACPPTGKHILETIASVEAFKPLPPPPDHDDPQLVPQGECGLKRKLTTHEDLMSVLSVPMHRRSTRARRNAQKAHESTAHILEELVVEEARYSKELRTLVDGVVPVLLQAVLTKSTSIAAAGLFNASSDPSDFSYTKPIIDMGISLERLKSLHARIPMQSIDALLAWAQNARRAYGDYIKAWRLGFQDVVVHLAPLDGKDGEIDAGMAQDTEGNVVDSKGEKVDVAFLLKRPLVRVKNLAKTFESIKACHDKALAVEVWQAFADLTSAARQRHREEQARLEDEAAAALDSSRARNVRTLGPCTEIVVRKSRKVRARDTFDLALWHSTGQRLDCQVEMIYRDDPTTTTPGGDVLICEVDEGGKWLLFPPIELSTISARRGEDDIDLVVMLRGPSGIGKEWHELLALTSEDAEAVGEWLTMLGSCPLPPRLNRTRSFLERRDAAAKQQTSRPTTADSKTDTVSVSVPSEPDTPLGEPSVLSVRTDASSSRSPKTLMERFVPRLHLGGGLQSKPNPKWPSPTKVPPRKPVPSTVSSDPSIVSDRSGSQVAGVEKPAKKSVQDVSSRNIHESSRSPPPAESYMMSGALLPPQVEQEENKPSGPEPAPEPERSQKDATESGRPTRPTVARQLSATPSEGLPSIPKLRSNTTQDAPQSTVPLTDSIRDQWAALSGTDNNKRQVKSSLPSHGAGMPSSPAETSRHSSERTVLPNTDDRGAPPLPPPHREGSAAHQKRTPVKKLDSVPQLTPKSNAKRRSSSPLKHEYAPSTASNTTSDSESDYGTDASSETSDDFMSEVKDISTPLVAVTGGNRRNSQPARPAPSRPPPSSAPPTAGTRTLAPSDSASQGPYRRVPSSTAVPSDQKSRTIALICSWSDRGMWEQVHPDECSIVVSPGLIEAFQMSAAHSGQGSGPRQDDLSSILASEQAQPLVAFELTPIVPLRRGTALDINIRSPPTANSTLKTTNNILFRSRNADECDILYNMINWARCNNPTYIQLEKARPKQPPVSFNTGPARHSRSRSGGSWFSFGNHGEKSSYRASSAPMSVGGETDASNSTMASAFSALKRLGVSSAFNLNRSSVSRKSGWTSQTSGSLYSSNSGTGSGSGTSTPIPSQVGFIPGRDGPNVPETSAEAANGGGMVNNMKIRIYMRKGQQWANLGSGRLSVLPAPESPPPTADNTAAETNSPNLTPIRGQPGSKGPRLASSGHTPHRLHGDGREKRIVVRKTKKDDVVLLDAVLGESCFERVMQTGIAVKVWIENEAVADTGGVMMGKEQIYMLQFPGTREAGWVFGLVGRYRYTGGG